MRQSVLTAAVIFTFIMIVSGGEARAFQHKNTPGNLKSLFQKMQQAHATGDAQTARALTEPLFPDEKRLRKGLREDVSGKTVDTILALHRKFMSSIPLEKLFEADPANTEVQVHGATTEEIALNKKGTIVYQEFPGGAVDLAGSVLRSGVTFYEVELLKPGQSRGMKFHLFYWDGSGWSMIGPAWRALK